MYSILCSFPDRKAFPAVLTLQGTATKAATRLISKLRSLRAPSFGVVVEMTSSKSKTPSVQSYNYAFEVVGPVENRAFYEENFAQYRFFIEQGLKVRDMESVQKDEARSAEEEL
jgi:Mrp family chromosome partitioning ATPase